jgi:thymidylate synthase ThyX
MPEYREIEVFRIVEPKINHPNMQEWINKLGAKDFCVPGDQPVGTVISGVAAKSCYNSFEVSDELNPNVQRVRTIWRDFIENVLQQEHGSVFHHVNYTYAIMNCTRVFTAEMNRHHAGVGVSERSLRFVRYTKIPFWMPYFLRAASWWREDPAACLNSRTAEEYATDYDNHVYRGSRSYNDILIELKKQLSRNIIGDVLIKIEDAHNALVNIWDAELKGNNFKIKKLITTFLRRILPMGICTGAMYTFNLRALRYIFEQRISSGAEEEIIGVATLIARDIISCEPDIFCDFVKLDGLWVPNVINSPNPQPINKYRKV